LRKVVILATLVEWFGIHVFLQGFNETEIKFKLANVQKIWQRFLYRDAVLLEAERQKTSIGHVDDWAIEFLKLTEDDVTATLIQVLFFICQNHFRSSPDTLIIHTIKYAHLILE